MSQLNFSPDWGNLNFISFMNHYQLSSLDSRVTQFPFFGYESIQKQCEIMGGGSFWCLSWLWRRVSHLEPYRSLQNELISSFSENTEYSMFQAKQCLPGKLISLPVILILGTIPYKNYGLKLHKPGINEQITLANGAVATDGGDVKWMYLYVHKRFYSVAFKYMLAF